VLEELGVFVGLIVEALPRGDLEGEIELLRQRLHRSIDDVVLAAPRLRCKEDARAERSPVGQRFELGTEGDEEGQLQRLLIPVDIVHSSRGVAKPPKDSGDEEFIDLVLGRLDAGLVFGLSTFDLLLHLLR
jgi:hypothetical protein